MASATIQFATAEIWEGGAGQQYGPGLTIDADDGTFGAVGIPGVQESSSFRLTNPILPADFESLNSLTVRLYWRHQLDEGRGAPWPSDIYSREDDAEAWVQRYDFSVGPDWTETTGIAVPVVDITKLQILIQHYRSLALDDFPPPPPMAGDP
jgi:hypothetical protein